MIRQACYVTCDRCGDPAEVSVEGALVARNHAAQQGFRRIPVQPDATRAEWLETPTGRKEDVCKRCLTPLDHLKGNGVATSSRQTGNET